MVTFERIGFVRSSYWELLAWCCQAIEKGHSSTSRVATERIDRWFFKGIELQNNQVVEADRDERLRKLGEIIFPGFDSCLLSYHPQGSFTDWHRDHSAGQAPVVEINLGTPCLLEIGNRPFLLDRGEVVKFNSKITHKSSPARNERFVLTFRKISAKYLNRQLSLNSRNAESF